MIKELDRLKALKESPSRGVRDEIEISKLEAMLAQSAYYDERHGGPYDRGAADSYYHRPFDPHYYRGDSYCGPRIEMKDMTAQEIVAYTAGYRYNEASGNKKDWG
jgi:hypothetical protein